MTFVRVGETDVMVGTTGSYVGTTGSYWRLPAVISCRQQRLAAEGGGYRGGQGRLAQVAGQEAGGGARDQAQRRTRDRRLHKQAARVVQRDAADHRRRPIRREP